MTAKLYEEAASPRLHIKTPPPLLAKVHAWRRQQQEPPSLSAAFRELVELGLEASTPKKSGKHGRRA